MIARNTRSFCSCSGKSRSTALCSDQADGEPVCVVSRRRVGADEGRAGHGRELSAAVMEHELDMRQGLEAAAEAGSCLARALCDRADTAAVRRVEVEDAVGLCVPERAQDNCLGGHAPPAITAV